MTFDESAAVKAARLLSNRELDDEVSRLSRIWPRDIPREEEIEQEMVRRG